MNNQKINEILGELKVPPTNAAERAKYRALTAFKLRHREHRGTEDTEMASPFLKSLCVLCSSVSSVSYSRLCAGASVVVITIVAAVTLFSNPHQTDASEKLLAQVSQLFPDRLNAVIERNGTAEIALAETADPALIADQPLVVNLVRGGEKIKVLSFSGRVVRLEIDGREVTFETLVTADGQVIVSGDNFFWNHENPNPLLGYRIQAQPLIASL